MSKRILSLMLSFVMVFSMLVAVPATAATYEATDIKVIPDKTTAAPGDTINYSIVMGPVSDLGSLQMELVIPEGLTYVANSGAIPDGLREAMGFDALEWTEESKIVNGGASAADYNSDSDTTLATFQCTVNDGYTGTATLDLSYLEFYSCKTWDDHTERFSVVTTPVTVSAGSGEGGSEPEAPLADYEIRVTADKKEVVAGDTVNFTITMGPVENLGSLQMELVIPEGLTYVTGSGATSVTKEALGFDAFDWTDETLVLNGGASESDYASDEPTELMTFQCTVNDNFSGTATLDLTYLEFYSCKTWEEYTELYTVTPAVLKSPAGVETPFSDYELRITADKTDALPGDIINFTVAMGPVENLGSMQMQLVIPKGLTYVPNSGAIPDGLKEAMGFDALDWTEESLVINGGASAADYASTSKTVLATFQCQADANFSGVKEVGLTYLEFYSCQLWQEFTHLYFVTPAVINGPAPTTSALTFVTDGSAVPAVEEIEPGTTIDLSAYTTSKDGYRFMGWYAEDTYENLVTSVTVDSDTTVYAKFLKEYKLTYYVDEAVNEEVVGVDGQVITLKDVPAKSGYDVLGWFVDNAGEAVKEVTLNSDVNVYAQYEYIPIQYTVTFMVDGEEYGTFKVGEGRTLVLANAIENPTKATYRFDGWALNGAIVTEVYGDGDKTVEAQFVKQYTLTYTAEGFATETETVDVDTVIDLSTNIPEKEFYIFTGWTLEGAVVTSVTMDADKEVVATYVDAEAIVDDVEYASFAEAFAALADGSEMKFYKDLTTDAPVAINNDVEIDLNGKKVTSSADEAFEINADATIKNGAIDADGVAVAVKAAATVDIEDVDVKANTAISVADAAAEVTVDADSTIEAADAALALSAAGKVALNAPVTGKVIGAYTAGASITTTNEDVADAMDAEGFIVNGGNVAGEARTLTFVTGAGNIAAPAEMRIVKDTVVDLTKAEYILNPTDYNFAGWYSDANFSTKLDSIQVTDDATVYAKFETVLTFDTKGGDAMGAVTFVKDTVADLSHYVPTYGSYDFVGWYADTYYTTPADAMLVMDTHKTIYAKWKAAEGQYDANKAYMIEAEARTNPDNGEKVFNAGETVYVDYTISSNEIDTLGSFQFDIVYDTTRLELVDIKPMLTAADGVLYTDKTRNRVSFDVDGNKKALDITGGKLVATAVFEVIADPDAHEGEAAVGIVAATETNGVVCEVTPQGYDKNVGFINLVDDTVLIKNIVVTFQSGANAAFVPTDDDITTKVNYNVEGFIEVGFKVPADVLVPADDFRLCNDVTEPLWFYVEENRYVTSAQINTTPFTKDATFIAQVVATGDITIVVDDNGTPDDPSDDKGTIEAEDRSDLVIDKDAKTITFTVDAGTVLTNDVIEEYINVDPAPGYVFDKFDPTDHVVSGDKTIKVLFKDGTYTISNTIDPSLATVTDEDNNVVTTQSVTHGTDFVFTVTPVDTENNPIVEVGYIIDGVVTSLTPDETTGKYTIPGNAIIGEVEIYAVAADQFIVSFVAGDHGSMSAPTNFYINKGDALTSDDMNEVAANIVPEKGYKFVYYAIDESRVTVEELTSKAIYANLTVDVIFDHQSYKLTREDGEVVDVTHGTNYTFVPAIDGKIITNVTGEYATETGAPTVKKNADGSYTVVGDTIIDDITIKAETIDGTIRFILNSQYRAIYGGHANDGERKIAVLETAQLAAGKKFMINSGDFHWSSTYNAYVHVVKGLTEYEGETAAQIVSQLVIKDDAAGEAYDVDYSGDMNKDGKLTAADAMIITDMLHQQREVPTSERHVLMADVTTASGTYEYLNEKVTTADVDYVRIKAQNN